MSDSMRILHGITDCAGQAAYSVKGLKELGYSAKTAYYVNISNPVIIPDINLKLVKRKIWLYPWYAIKVFCFFIYAMFAFNVFHFHCGHSLLPGNIDLPILKSLNKKLIAEFHGSELRRPSIAKEVNPYFPAIVSDEKKSIKKTKKMVKYADALILHDTELIRYLPKVDIPIHIVPLRMDVNKIAPAYMQNDNSGIKIMHAPSNRFLKGTQYIIDAVSRIEKDRDDIELVLVENVKYSEALQIYKKANIIVDQILIGSYGLFSVEAMAFGKPVIVYLSKDMENSFPADSPLINANPDDLKNVIERILDLSSSELEKIGRDGRKYVEKYHDYKKNASLLAKIYKGENVGNAFQHSYTGI